MAKRNDNFLTDDIMFWYLLMGMRSTGHISKRKYKQNRRRIRTRHPEFNFDDLRVSNPGDMAKAGTLEAVNVAYNMYIKGVTN